MDRATAKAAGLKHYMGNPCDAGHVGKRYVACGKCVECINDRRIKNRERIAAYMKEWAAKNPAKKREGFASWRQRNADYDKERCLQWQKLNRAKTVAGIAKRKAALLQRTPAWADLKKIEQFYARSAMLTEETGEIHHVDHIVPLQGKLVSGFHVPANLQVLTAVENRKKGNRHA